MATQRALVTTQEDFKIIDQTKPGYPGLVINPLIYHNLETDSVSTELPGGSYTGVKIWVPSAPATADIVDGIRGKAVKFNKNKFYTFRDYQFPASDKYMISAFVKPTQADLTQTFAIIATNRGDGYTANKGFHLALTSGAIDVRAYGNDMSLLLDTSGTNNGIPQFKLTADQWYHIVLLYDKSAGYIRVYVNGALVLNYTATAYIPTFSSLYERSFVIGDMPASNTTLSAYAFNGVIDEVFIAYGSNVLTEAQIQNYYDVLYNRKLLDDATEPGSLQLPKLLDGTYRSGFNYSWESKVIDIGDPPIDYFGRLQLTADYDPAYHTISLSTRVSDDGINFDEWQAVGADGTLYSPKKRYYQIRADLITNINTSTPILKELEILEYVKPIQYDLVSEPLRVYADLDTGLKSMGILNRAYDIEIEEEIKAKDILTFKLPMDDPKRRALGSDAVEFLLRLGNRRYILKENRDKKDSSGKKISDFKAEAKWYELNDNKHIDYELVEADVVAHVTKILGECIPATGWKLNLNLSSKRQLRTIRGKWKSALQLLREVESTFGVELKFYYDDESESDNIDIVDKIGDDKKIRFYYNKNIKEIERIIDTYGMVTRLYLYGSGELDITTVNNGLPYIDNLEWVNRLNLRNKIRPDEFRDDRYTIPENLLEDGESILAEQAKPNITYSMSLLDLSSRSGHEPESINLGDTAYPVDEDLMIDYLPSRIMRRKYNVREPHKTEVELDQPKKELADVQSRAFDDSVQTLTESDPVTSADIQEMTVFNHLLNSRADDGLEGWTPEGVAGISASAEGGFSGENSFKIEAAYDEYKKIYQEVFNVSHRSTYTISALVYKEGKITAGANGFVGIRVRVKYQDGAEETKLLKIPDVTNMSYEPDPEV